ncbi:MAG: 2-(3-amino-3-carboxypropyl)histidine synthase [Chloroflexi bacterium]|nr:2-(3-amino-3-carboxypropyl)histidine synthase [Chloroflexota bacterium]
MEDQEKLDKPIGDKELEKLKAGKVVVAGVRIEYVEKAKTDKVAFIIKHPDQEDTIEISSAKVLIKDKLKVYGLWYKLDKDENIQKGSTLAVLMEFLKIGKLTEAEGKEVIIPEGIGRAFHPGQILGCEVTGPKSIEENIDAYLSVSNQFHTLGLALSTEKPVLLLDPVNKKVNDLQEIKKKILQKRYALIEKAKAAQTFGILVSVKSGQINTIVAENIKEKLIKQGKEAIIITMKEFQPDELLNFSTIEVFIDTACPRVAIEDQPRYSKPMLTLKELSVVLNEITWEESLKTGFITAPYGAK